MKFKIKTNLWSGIIMGLFSIAMLIAMPGQVRLPMFDSENHSWYLPGGYAGLFRGADNPEPCI